MSNIYQPHINDFKAWVYPEVNSSIVNEVMIDTISVKEVTDSVENEPQEIPPIIQEEVKDEHSDALLDDKINYLDALGSQMADVLSGVDASLLQSIVSIIKQSVKKIILKELALDEHAIKQMIDQSLEKINKDKAPCVIHVAEDDYPVFDNLNLEKHLKIVTDPELTRGSFIIKTKFSKLHAILEDRLTVLFGL